jgi:hypothetical protein
MLLTDGGIDQLELWRNRIAARIGDIVLGRQVSADESYQAAWETGELAGLPGPVEATAEPDLMRFRSQVRARRTEDSLTGHEQRARVLALRGLSQARDGEYERAQTTFASAARLDPRLDLALLPSLWNLSRRAHDVAVAALHDANRGRDAAALTATIRTRFRPQALRAINRPNDSAGD